MLTCNLWPLIRPSIIWKWSDGVTSTSRNVYISAPVDLNAKYKVDLLWYVLYAGPLGRLDRLRIGDTEKDVWILANQPTIFYGSVRNQWGNPVRGVTVQLVYSYRDYYTGQPRSVTFTGKTGYLTIHRYGTGSSPTESVRTRTATFEYAGLINYWWNNIGFLYYEGDISTTTVPADYYVVIVFDPNNQINELCGEGSTTYISSTAEIIFPDGYEGDSFNAIGPKPALIRWFTGNYNY